MFILNHSISTKYLELMNFIDLFIIEYLELLKIQECIKNIKFLFWKGNLKTRKAKFFI